VHEPEYQSEAEAPGFFSDKVAVAIREEGVRTDPVIVRQEILNAAETQRSWFRERLVRPLIWLLFLTPGAVVVIVIGYLIGLFGTVSAGVLFGFLIDLNAQVIGLVAYLVKWSFKDGVELR
jgi:hypothetical protein